MEVRKCKISLGEQTMRRRRRGYPGISEAAKAESA